MTNDTYRTAMYKISDEYMANVEPAHSAAVSTCERANAWSAQHYRMVRMARLDCHSYNRRLVGTAE